MPPPVAALISALFIWWCIKLDNASRLKSSKALWIPLFWLLLLGSRPLSFWLGTSSGGGSLEGNSSDMLVYMTMIGASLIISVRRSFKWGVWAADNVGIVVFYGVLLASCAWSDFPFVTFKRVFKDFGAIFLVIVILSEARPLDALESVYNKCAIILFVVSLLFIRYYPEMGRWYSAQGGLMITGVTQQKNSLGEDVLVFGLVVIFGLIRAYSLDQARKISRPMLVILAIGLYLLQISDSKTALICLVTSCVVLLSDKLPIIGGRPRLFLCLIFIVPIFGIGADKMFGISDELLHMIGRDPTLTNRTAIWEAVKEHPVNPLFGAGYLMYWDITGEIMVGGYATFLKTAHNGYLEIYLDGGFLGVGTLAFMLLVTGAKLIRQFPTGGAYGRLQLAFFLSLLIYNFSESAFARRGPIWFAFLMFCVDYRRAIPTLNAALAPPGETEAPPENAPITGLPSGARPFPSL